MNRLARHGDGMKGAMAVAVLVVAVLFAPLAVTSAAAERGLPPRDEPIVEHGTTLRFEGGEWVRVRIGDVSLGVIWSTNASMGVGPRLFLDYQRFFGGAELYDEQGNYLRTIPLPLSTVLMQQLGRMVEFRDVNGDGRFDFRFNNRTIEGEYPLRMLNLGTAWSLEGDIEQFVSPDVVYVNFTIGARDLRYSEVYDPTLMRMRPATDADGVLDAIRLTFRLEARISEGSAVVPFYKVFLANGESREPSRFEFIENRTVTGRTFAVTGKYDQLIQGWDFSGEADAKLALLSHLTFGNRYREFIVDWLQGQFGGACLKDGSFEHCESDEGPAQPVRIERTQLQVAEGWHRAGDWSWTSDVLVDGQPATMTFEIYHATPVDPDHQRVDFYGFQAFGAFVYPQGQTIFHDPGLSATALLPAISEATNLAPSVLVALQLAVVGIALVPAILLRRRKGTA